MDFINPFQSKTHVVLLTASETNFLDQKSGQNIRIRKASMWDFSRKEILLDVRLPDVTVIADLVIGGVYEVTTDSKTLIVGSSATQKITGANLVAKVGHIDIVADKLPESKK